MDDVKAGRPTRAERALQTRRRMLSAAHAEFVERGYAATTMNDIAAMAGVAVQTLYYSFRTKGLLLREVMEAAAGGGADPGPVPERRWLGQITASDDPQRILALCAEHGTSVYERAAPLWPVIRAAALVEPDVDHYWRGIAAARRVGMGRMVEKVATVGVLRPDLSLEKAIDVVCALAGHASFHDLVVEAGWPVAEFKAWLFRTLVHQLLGPVEVAPEAAEGLSFQQLLSAAS